MKSALGSRQGPALKNGRRYELLFGVICSARCIARRLLCFRRLTSSKLRNAKRRWKGKESAHRDELRIGNGHHKRAGRRLADRRHR